MKNIRSRVIVYEVIGFLAVIVLLFVNEIFDMPNRLFGAEPTPFNIRESLAEAWLVLVLGCFIIYQSWLSLKRIKYLEGFIRVCAYCKKINLDEKWIPFEMYLNDTSKLQFTHGICDECTKKLNV
ncbi:MAG: hypothetical protein ABH859_04835 [Pseudomonadota bacterium]